MGMFSTVVVALDLSEMSRDVLRYAVRLAASSPTAQLLITHVVPDPLERPWSAEAIGADFTRVRRTWVSRATDRLETLIEAEGLTAGHVTPVVLVGRPANMIVQLAEDRQADAIVLGTHGYGPVKHLVLGSVAERVLRRSTCPVVTVPHKSLETIAQRAVLESESLRLVDVEC
jgi:nucleotide-binding universal stress UspA family protein